MCFFNKKKKWKNLNDQSKREFLSILEAYIQRTKDNSLAAKLESAKAVLNEQGSSSSKELVKLDISIRQYLADLNKEIAAGNNGVAISKMNKILEMLRERSPFCADNTEYMTPAERKKKEEAEKALEGFVKKNGAQQGELYTPEQLIEFMIEEAAEQLKKYKEEQKRLYAVLSADPNDGVALSGWRNIKVKIETAQQRLGMLSDESYRATLTKSVHGLTAEQKRLIGMRKVSDEQFDLLMQDYNKMLARQKEDNARTEGAANAFFNSGKEGHGSAAAAGTAVRPSILDDPDFIAMGGGQAASAAARPAAARPAIFDDPDFIAMGGAPASAPDAGDAALEETLECIDDIIQSLRKCEIIYSRQIEKSDEDRKDLDIQLEQLLNRRKGATASECIVLDGEIDRLYAERQSVIDAISRFRQEQAINTERRRFAAQLKTMRDIKSIRSRARDMMGTEFSRLEDFALALRDSAQKGNEELERMGTVNAVASGVDINMSTMSGREARSAGEFLKKDEDKYKALEEELGIGKK